MDLLKELRTGKLKYNDFYQKFIEIRQKEKNHKKLTPEEISFMWDSIPVLAVNPQEFLNQATK